jgi:DoxX-like family
MTDRNKTRLSWFLRLIAAVIMLQTLFFKFSAAEESVYIFSTLGLEPWGRIGTGVMELIASVLILIPGTMVIGAILALGIMAGALLSHLFVLGIEVRGDGGQLFIYALLVFFSSLLLLLLDRKKITGYLQSFFLK